MRVRITRSGWRRGRKIDSHVEALPNQPPWFRSALARVFTRSSTSAATARSISAQFVAVPNHVPRVIDRIALRQEHPQQVRGGDALLFAVLVNGYAVGILHHEVVCHRGECRHRAAWRHWVGQAGQRLAFVPEPLRRARIRAAPLMATVWVISPSTLPALKTTPMPPRGPGAPALQKGRSALRCLVRRHSRSHPVPETGVRACVGGQQRFQFVANPVVESRVGQKGGPLIRRLIILWGIRPAGACSARFGPSRNRRMSVAARSRLAGSGTVASRSLHVDLDHRIGQVVQSTAVGSAQKRNRVAGVRARSPRRVDGHIENCELPE